MAAHIQRRSLRSPEIFFALWMLLFSSLSLFASVTTNGLPHYSSRVWQIDDGLPHNTVQSILQTKDGYLWIGTQEGLARFDGVRFKVFDQKAIPEIKNRSITTLCESRDGTLWIGTEGGGLTQMRGGIFRHYGMRDGLSGDIIRALAEAADGTLWIGTTNGLCSFQNGKFTAFAHPDLASAIVRWLHLDEEGGLWIASSKGLFELKDRHLTAFTVEQGLPDNWVRAVWRDQQGTVWAGSNSGLTGLRDGKILRFSQSDGLLDSFVVAFHEDQKRRLWIGTLGGLNCLVDGKTIHQIPDADGVDQVNAICEDREGNIWIGMKDGLNRLTAQRFTSYTKEQGLTHNNTLAILEDKSGVMWIGTWGGGLNRMSPPGKNETSDARNEIGGYQFNLKALRPAEGILRPSLFTNYTAYLSTNGLASDLILSLHEDRQGALWIGTDFKTGLFRFKDGEFERFFELETEKDPAIRVIYEDHEGVLWIGTRSALFSFKDGQSTRYALGPEGSTVRAIVEDTEKNLWIGTQDGLWLRENEKFTSFTTSNGLSANAIYSLYADPDGTLWVGTRDGGLCKMRRHESRITFSSFTTKHGLFSDDVFEIVEDDHGFLWMTCLSGIFRANKENLSAIERGEAKTISCMSYGKADGLASVQCPGVGKPAAWKARDGRLWFVTTKGVSVVDPATILRPGDPPPVMIEEVMADKRNVTSGEWQVTGSSDLVTRRLSPVTLPPGRGELEFHYTALSFEAPERVRFKYRLEGVDRDWVEAGTRRVAFYNNLKPGKYEFRVIACNRDSVWNEAGARLPLTLRPHFWQAGWFMGLVAIAAAGTVGGTARYITRKKMQQQLRRLEQQHAIEKERARIARDMHDDLGVRLTELLLVAARAQKKETSVEDTKSLVGKMSNSIHEVVGNLDAIVWAVNPQNDSLERFVPYICEYIQSLLEPTTICFSFDIPDELPNWPLSSEVRHNLYMVIRESLNNIVKHAQATEVCFRVKAEEAKLIIIIDDNGKGFSITADSTFGNGLKNMKKRMESIGGRLEIASIPGKGASLQFIVPKC